MYVQGGEHGSIAPIEVAVAEAGKHVPEDRLAQRCGLALLAHDLPAGAGEGALQIGIGAVKGDAGDAVAELDGRQPHGEG